MIFTGPLVFNTDQGAPITSKAFTDLLKDNQVKISMDSRCLVQDRSPMS
ncbi:hypothetical protein ACFL9U_06855 [Thermodesulfobacteriota bacterium]